MIRLKGKRFAGENNANRTIGTQLPHIAKAFPEIARCHSGTINLELEFPLIVVRSDHRTPPIKWKGNLKDGEVFDLVRVFLEVPFDGPRHQAWLYVAHRSRHRLDLRRHEVIAPFIEINDTEEYGLVVERPYVELPYKHNPLYVLT